MDYKEKKKVKKIIRALNRKIQNEERKMEKNRKNIEQCISGNMYVYAGFVFFSASRLEEATRNVKILQKQKFTLESLFEENQTNEKKI